MELNIDKKPSFRIAGLSYQIKKRTEADALRKEFFNSYKDRGLEEFGAFYGLMAYNAIANAYDYFLGFEIADQEVIDDLGFEVREIAESLYYMPIVEGIDLESSYQYVYEKFFPNKKYFHGLGPDIEFYQYDEGKDEIGKAELYICLMENPHIE